MSDLHIVDLSHRVAQPRGAALGRAVVRSRHLLLLLLPGLLYYLVFRYAPMYGLIIAFKRYQAWDGILGSPWVGLKHFVAFFSNPLAGRLIRNTFLLSLSSLAFAFPAPIILALLLNEVRVTSFKRVVQTVSYLPHFISEVIVVGMLVNFLSPSQGLINNIIVALGGEPVFFLAEPGWFRPLYVLSGIWKDVGWSAIIYIAALAGINPELYEAAVMDGAGRLRRVWNVSIPGIMPTVTVILILRLGHLLDVGFEKVLLMYNPAIYETADVIATFIYRRGILGADFSFAAAIGLINNVVALVLVLAANRISKSLSEHSLW